MTGIMPSPTGGANPWQQAMTPQQGGGVNPLIQMLLQQDASRASATATAQQQELDRRNNIQVAGLNNSQHLGQYLGGSQLAPIIQHLLPGMQHQIDPTTATLLDSARIYKTQAEGTQAIGAGQKDLGSVGLTGVVDGHGGLEQIIPASPNQQQFMINQRQAGAPRTVLPSTQNVSGNETVTKRSGIDGDGMRIEETTTVTDRTTNKGPGHTGVQEQRGSEQSSRVLGNAATTQDTAGLDPKVYQQLVDNMEQQTQLTNVEITKASNGVLQYTGLNANGQVEGPFRVPGQ